MCGQHGETGESQGVGDVFVSRAAERLQTVADKYPDEFAGVDAKDWLSSVNNLAIEDGLGNWGLFHKQADGIYTGHYFFSVKGKAAKALAIQMLEHFFKTTGVSVLRGLTPVDNRAARWMSRQIGFSSLAIIDTDHGPCELFIMIRE